MESLIRGKQCDQRFLIGTVEDTKHFMFQCELKTGAVTKIPKEANT